MRCSYTDETIFSKMVKAIGYRVGQFLRALTARYTLPRQEIEQATSILTPKMKMLFNRQSAQDRHHALRVYQTLRQGGHTNQVLLTAALLHDVGKAAAQLSIWQRSVIVLLDRLAPGILARLSRVDNPNDEAAALRSWRTPFVVYTQHAEIGAQWAQEAGCSPLTVALIRRHTETISSTEHVREEDQLLAALKRADRKN